MNRDKRIFVYGSSIGDGNVLIGSLFFSIANGKEYFSFEFDEDYLSSGNRLYLGPELQYYSGRQYPLEMNGIFGMFSDSCPDRWGRKLLKRKEEIEASKEGKKPRRLDESDYLLGVCDETRMGSFRYSLEKDGPFLEKSNRLSVPPINDIRNLESAYLSFEDHIDEDKWLKMLISPGSSLGGSRPKANIKERDGSLWIAKFPSKEDDFDIGAWELVANQLGVLCGLDMATEKIAKYSKYGSTLLSKRFDREGSKRLHFSSAMALLGKRDGEESSYLDIASFIRGYGSDPKKDLKELWKRLFFNMAISNTDDHLRNHGFILNRNGWKLAPAYDVNPVNYGNNLSLNVDSSDSGISAKLAISVAKYFFLGDAEAHQEASKIVGIIKENWRPLADRCGIERSEQERMAPAFSLKLD